ncbi:uncharacterized protein N0V89_009843 [Didymosphaeria variabile]|uniref:Uncharacterized protein n=1 Tax=Didymosphaeria variabile TaxID=1932322 RepID=A0A9W8XE42_9PLEO|nr:uncharacterized protein N0V89_009843 [Didymosphaeria variabile]KAJ4348468.1 hypothetical protein N0V89_009843 [Didymosphaeria variabile]
MDTPAFTPETLHSSLGSSSTQPPQKPGNTNNNGMAFSNMDFFANALRPLSPPESPFNFNAAFSNSKPPSRTSTAPASPHLDLPKPVKRASPNLKLQARARSVQPQKKTEVNPYFPSIAEQQRSERWMRDAARLPQGSPPSTSEAPLEAPRPSSRERASSDGALTLKLDLSSAQRRRALKICTFAQRGGGLPASPESLPESSSGQKVAEEYSRNMAQHLQEKMRRRSVRPTPWGKDFEW